MTASFYSLPLYEYIGKKTGMNDSDRKRSESRTILNKYYSVQFSLNGREPVYLFKLRDISLNGLCILVKEDSPVLKQLKVGDILNMEYNPPELSDAPKTLKTQVTSKKSYDYFSGHSLVELSIVDEHVRYL